MFHGRSPYCELNHAPLLLWQPDSISAGVLVDEVIGTIDLMPTLLNLRFLYRAGAWCRC